jgi:PRC-barrel domain
MIAAPIVRGFVRVQTAPDRHALFSNDPLAFAPFHSVPLAAIGTASLHARCRECGYHPWTEGDVMQRFLCSGVLAVLLATAPAMAQEKQEPSKGQPEAALVGLPIFSSDGEKLGEIKQVVTEMGEKVALADMGTFLGMGPSTVIIPTEMLQQKGERTELTMTAAEVKSSISTQRPQQQQPQQK